MRFAALSNALPALLLAVPPYSGLPRPLCATLDVERAGEQAANDVAASRPERTVLLYRVIGDECTGSGAGAHVHRLQTARALLLRANDLSHSKETHGPAPIVEPAVRRYWSMKTSASWK